jgi:Tol biopolymer transport system component
MRLRTGSFITTVVIAAVIAAGAGGTRARARQAEPAELAFEAARKTEVVDRDLRGAAAKYQEVAARYSSNHAVAASALVRLAGIYEQLGQPDARVTYQRIVREFGDVPAAAAIARTKMVGMSAVRAQSDGLAPRRLAEIERAGPCSATADGQRIVAQQGQTLVMYDIRSGQRTVLLANSSAGYGAQPKVSPDGRQVAYTWMTATGMSVGVIGTEAEAKPRLLGEMSGPLGSPTFYAPEAIGWSADGKSILVGRAGGTSTAREIELVWISSANGTTTLVRTLGPVRATSGFALSPDRRFVAYSSASGATEGLASNTNPDQRIFVASLNGPQEAEVVKMVGSHSDPVWTPDGGHLLFTSTRALTSGLWTVPVANGVSADSPKIVRSDFPYVPLAVTSSGVFLATGRSGGGTATYVVSRPGGRVETTFPGGGGDWSPDGHSFAFKPRNGLGSEVIVRSVDSAEERSLKHENIMISSPHWVGNRRFVVQIRDAAPMVYAVDAASGVFRPLYPAELDGYTREGFAGADDGSKIVTLYRKPGGPLLGVVTIDATTGEAAPPTLFPDPLPAQSVAGLDVSPDGSTAVVMWKLNATTARLVTIRLDGSDYRQVGQPFPVSRTPDLVRWTPDGQSILYVVTENGQSRVMRIPATGGTPQSEGIDVEGQIFTIDPSPDGAQLAYNALAPYSMELWGIDNILLALGR